MQMNANCNNFQSLQPYVLANHITYIYNALRTLLNTKLLQNSSNLMIGNELLVLLKLEAFFRVRYLISRKISYKPCTQTYISYTLAL